MQLGDNRRPHDGAPFPHRFRIRDLVAPDPRERAIHQIRADLPLHHGKAPVAHVFQDEQPQHDLGWRAGPPAPGTLRPPLAQRPVHRCHQRLIVQQPIRVAHPGLLQIAHGFGNERVPELPLPAPRVRHGRLADRRGAAGVRCQRCCNAARFTAAIAHPVSQNVAQAL